MARAKRLGMGGLAQLVKKAASMRGKPDRNVFIPFLQERPAIPQPAMAPNALRGADSAIFRAHERLRAPLQAYSDGGPVRYPVRNPKTIRPGVARRPPPPLRSARDVLEEATASRVLRDKSRRALEEMGE